MERENNEYRLLVYPAVIVLAAIAVIPTVYGLWLSLCRIVEGSGGKQFFVFLTNYIGLLRQAIFWHAILLTLFYMVVCVSLSIMVGFGLALMLNHRIYGRQAILSLFVLPIVATPVVAGLIWKFMFSADGIVDYFLHLLRIGKIYWLSKPSTAVLAIIIVEVWQWSPFCMLFLLAGLESVPFSTTEAAFIDGANSFQIFWSVLLPQMLPIVSVVLLLRIMDTFKSFDAIFVMTQGGPGSSTETMNILAYYVGFRYFNLGQASALGFVVLFLVVLISTRVIRFTRQ
jgi:multiple sugar transport system permease protein